MNKKTYSVLWSESAQFDLESIIDYIADESKVNAKKVFEDIKVHCLRFEDFPKIGKIPPELKNINIETKAEFEIKRKQSEKARWISNTRESNNSNN